MNVNFFALRINKKPVSLSSVTGEPILFTLLLNKKNLHFSHEDHNYLGVVMREGVLQLSRYLKT